MNSFILIRMIRAEAQHFLQDSMCAQRRLRSAVHFSRLIRDFAGNPGNTKDPVRLQEDNEDSDQCTMVRRLIEVFPGRTYSLEGHDMPRRICKQHMYLFIVNSTTNILNDIVQIP